MFSFSHCIDYLTSATPVMDSETETDGEAYLFDSQRKRAGVCQGMRSQVRRVLHPAAVPDKSTLPLDFLCFSLKVIVLGPQL